MHAKDNIAMYVEKLRDFRVIPGKDFLFVILEYSKRNIGRIRLRDILEAVLSTNKQYIPLLLRKMPVYILIGDNELIVFKDEIQIYSDNKKKDLAQLIESLFGERIDEHSNIH